VLGKGNETAFDDRKQDVLLTGPLIDQTVQKVLIEIDIEVIDFYISLLFKSPGSNINIDCVHWACVNILPEPLKHLIYELNTT